jgi:hypothetical protein
MINRPARIYHHQGDNLTSASSALSRATSMAKATSQLIEEHKQAWLNHCPCQLGKYNFYLGMYLALSGSMRLVLPSLFQAFRYGKWIIRRKTLLLFLACMLPLKLRQKLFLWQHGWRNR